MLKRIQELEMREHNCLCQSMAEQMMDKVTRQCVTKVTETVSQTTDGCLAKQRSLETSVSDLKYKLAIL